MATTRKEDDGWEKVNTSPPMWRKLERGGFALIQAHPPSKKRREKFFTVLTHAGEAESLGKQPDPGDEQPGRPYRLGRRLYRFGTLEEAKQTAPQAVRFNTSEAV